MAAKSKSRLNEKRTTSPVVARFSKCYATRAVRLVASAIVIAYACAAQGQQTAVPSSVAQERSFQLLREDEDWSFLQNQQTSKDFWDPLKYIHFRHNNNWYLTLGGEAREVWEQIGNDNWGQQPVAHGTLEEASETPRGSIALVSPHKRKGPQRAPTPNPAMADPLLTVEDVGRRLNVSKDWVWDHCWRKQPRLPVIRMGDGALRFRASAIEAFIDERERISSQRTARR